MSAERITDIPMPNECKDCVFSVFKQFQPRWIPVEERLPLVTYDEYGNHSSEPVILCMESGEIEIGFFNPVGTFETADDDGLSVIGSIHAGTVDYMHVIAWMPFPEPYERSEDGSQN